MKRKKRKEAMLPTLIFRSRGTTTCDKVRNMEFTPGKKVTKVSHGEKLAGEIKKCERSTWKGGVPLCVSEFEQQKSVREILNG